MVRIVFRGDASRKEPQTHESTFLGNEGVDRHPWAGHELLRGNTSCVELTTATGDLLIFDCGTGAHRLAAELMAKGKKAINSNILLGHTHWDHIQPGLCQRQLRRDLWPGRQPWLAA